jgi:beta-lactamase class A
MRFVSHITLSLLIAAAPVARAQHPIDSLRERLATRIAATPGAVVGISFHEFGRGGWLQVNPDSVFHAASTMKVPVMIEYFRGLDAKKWRRDQTLLLKNEFASIVDGSPYSLDAGEDSDSAMYGRVGQQVPIAELVERMITRSSNLATNAVIELVDAKKAQATALALGAAHIQVRRGVEDGKAFRAGLNNTTTAPDLAALLEAIYRGKAASAASCRTMMEILGHQEFNEEIPAGLPPGTRVAHKTGWITGVLHDAAIVLPEGHPAFVLVVLTRNIPEEKVARELIVDLSRLVWDYVAAVPAPRKGRS